jgi:hypothetical protein
MPEHLTPGVSSPALERVHDIAARALDAHSPVDGICPICRTSGVCGPVRVAAINFEMAGGSGYASLGPVPALP